MITELMVYMFGYDYDSMSLTTLYYSGSCLQASETFTLPEERSSYDGQLRPFSYNRRDPNSKQLKRDLYKKLPFYLQSFGRQEYLGVIVT